MVEGVFYTNFDVSSGWGLHFARCIVGGFNSFSSYAAPLHLTLHSKASTDLSN